MTDVAPVQLSPLDEERFGIRSARAASVTLETLPAILEFCRAHEVRFLIARTRQLARQHVSVPA